MKPLRVEVRLKNNSLLARREAAGISGTELAALAGVSSQDVYAYECMSRCPVDGRGHWRRGAAALAHYWGVSPEVLFPEVVHRVQRNRGSFAVDEAQVGALMAGASTRDSLPLLPEEVTERAVLSGEVRQHAERWFAHAIANHPSNARRINIWKMRYGWDTGIEMTFAEVAEVLDITTERVRQIVLKVERMMRHSTGLRGVLVGAEP